MLQPFSFQLSDDTIGLTAGAAKVTYRFPLPIQAIEVCASLTVAQSTGAAITVDIKKNGVSILDGPISIANGAKTSRPSIPVITGGLFLADDELTADVLTIGDGTAKGLKLSLLGYQPNIVGQASEPEEQEEPEEVEIAIGDGTPYGNMIIFGLGNAFDGNTNSVGNACAAIAGGPGFLGKSFSSPREFTKIIIHGANDRGFIDYANPATTIDVYVKASGSVPSVYTDGILVASLPFVDTSNEAAGREILLTGPNRTGMHIHARINGGPYSTYCAEMRPFMLEAG